MSSDIYVELDAIGLPCEVVQWLTFEEQVTNRNINRLQEVVDKWLYLMVPVVMSVIYWATYVILIGSERCTTLKVEQVISQMINGPGYYVL